MVKNIWKDFSFPSIKPSWRLIFRHDISKTMIVSYYPLSRDYIIPLSLSAPLCIIPFFFLFFFLLLEILLFIYARELLLVDTHNLSGTSLSWCPSRRRGLCKSSRGEVTTLNATKKKEEKREKESPHLAHFIEPVKMHFFTLVASLNVPVGGVIVCVLSARWNFLILAGSYRLMRNSCTGDNATDSSDLSLCVSAHTL